MNMDEEETDRPEIEKDTLEKFSPSLLRQYVDKIVTVSYGVGMEGSGVVYTIDPVSMSIILIDHNLSREVKPKIVVLPGHSVKSIKVTGHCSEDQKKILDDIFNDFTNSMEDTDEVNISKRKGELLEWFKKNRFPAHVSEDDPDVICIADALVIEPPYRPENCLSKNEIILNKIQNLMRSMPVTE